MQKFFTSNGDGFNNVWSIRGISPTYQVNSKLTVFDRFGKLVYHFKPSLESWDRTLTEIVYRLMTIGLYLKWLTAEG